MNGDEQRPDHHAGQARQAPDPRKKQASNATALVVLGVVLFLVGGALSAYGTGEGPGALLIGVLGVGLVVAGIVTRPRG